VGEIRDEHDENEEGLINRVSDNEYVVDAKIDLDDLFQALELEMDTEQFDFETLGGLIFDLAREIPGEGDTFEYGPLKLTVDETENNRIIQVRLHIERASQEATN
jgi:CBS domain containing-hemolysin-like protein